MKNNIEVKIEYIKQYYEKIQKQNINDINGKELYFTPKDIILPFIENINNIKNKKIAIVYNLEFVLFLIYIGCNPENITYYGDTEFRINTIKTLGCNVENIEDNYEGLIKMRKFDVIITNPPFTDENNGGQSIYPDIIEKIYDKCDDAIIICPTLFLYGAKNLLTLRKKIINKKGISKIRYLSKEIDWDNQIKIDTICLHLTKNKEDTTKTKIYKNSINYIEINLIGKDSIVDLGNNIDFIEKVYEIQNGIKFKVKDGTKKIKPKPNQVTIGINESSSKVKKLIHKCKYGSYNLTNTGDFWRETTLNPKVVFGLWKSNMILVVDKGIGIPGKYKYIDCPTIDYANKLADYFMSELIRFIAYKNRSATGFSAAQISYIPNIDLNQFDEINDEIIYKHFKIDINLQQYIKNEIKNNPKELNCPY